MQDLAKMMDDAAKELRRLRDRARVKAHLAGMDAKTAWDEELSPELERLEGELERSGREALAKGKELGGEARVQLHLGVMEARDRWAKLQPRLRETWEKAFGGAPPETAEPAGEKSSAEEVEKRHAEEPEKAAEEARTAFSGLRDSWRRFLDRVEAEAGSPKAE